MYLENLEVNIKSEIKNLVEEGRDIYTTTAEVKGIAGNQEDMSKVVRLINSIYIRNGSIGKLISYSDLGNNLYNLKWTI